GTDTTYWNNKLDDETDPVFGASIATGITAKDTTNWNTAFAWGDHSAAGYFADGGEATGADRTLGNTDNYELGLKTNNATRLLITNNGNVGIGTTTPTEKLEVNGNIKADTTYTDVLYSNKVGSGIYDFNINGTLWADSAYLDSLWVNADTSKTLLDFVLGVDSTGGQVYLIDKDSLGGATGWTLDTDTTSTDKYIGINTTDPQYEFDLVGSANIDSNIYIGDSIIFGAGSYIETYHPNLIYVTGVNGAYLQSSSSELKVAASSLLMNASGGSTEVLVTTTGLSVMTFDAPNEALEVDGNIATAGGNDTIKNYGTGDYAHFEDVLIDDDATVGGTLVTSNGTITDNDATPDVTGANIWTYAGSANSVTITDLDNPKVGAIYRIVGNSDTYTVTIADVGNFNLSAQWVGGIDDVLTLLVQADNDYIEISRSDN
ncbi:MAG: hypothetical protein K8R63_06560, partial [Bacteroidales bacterium]|nr:hypothetical protein [Bacteroidales bacterium]